MRATRQTNLRAIRVRGSSWLAGHQAPREGLYLVQRKVDRGEVRPWQMRCQVFRWGQQWRQVCCHFLRVYWAEFWRFSVPEMSRTKLIAVIVYRGRNVAFGPPQGGWLVPVRTMFVGAHWTKCCFSVDFWLYTAWACTSGIISSCFSLMVPTLRCYRDCKPLHCTFPSSKAVNVGRKHGSSTWFIFRR